MNPINLMIQNYLGKELQCGSKSALCDSTTLGSLLKGLKSIKCYPLPSAPYNKFPVESLRWELQKLSVSGLCEGSSDLLHKRGCSFLGRICDAAHSQGEKNFGLTLKHYTKRCMHYPIVPIKRSNDDLDTDCKWDSESTYSSET